MENHHQTDHHLGPKIFASLLTTLLGCPGQEVIGTMVRIHGLVITYLQMGYIGVVHPLILTLDPNFQHDIHVIYLPISLGVLKRGPTS